MLARFSAQDLADYKAVWRDPIQANWNSFQIVMAPPPSWVWRAPFLASVLMVAVGMWIRLTVSESPEFEKAKAENTLVKQPALQVLREDWRKVLQIAGLRLAETGGYYLATSFMVSYVLLAGVATKQNVLWGTMIGSALGLISHLLYGALSDKIGRKPVFLMGSLFTIAFGIPMFMMINTGVVALVVVAVAMALLLSHDPIFAVEASWFTEQFPANVRSSGISLGYNCASLIAGTLPFIATLLFAKVGWMGPALLFSMLGVISTVCGLKMRETAPAVAKTPQPFETLASAAPGRTLGKPVRH